MPIWVPHASLRPCPAPATLALAQAPGATPAPVPEGTQLISSFAIDRTEVTIGQFAKFVQSTDTVTRAEREGGGEVYQAGWTKKPGGTWRARSHTARGSCAGAATSRLAPRKSARAAGRGGTAWSRCAPITWLQSRWGRRWFISGAGVWSGGRGMCRGNRVFATCLLMRLWTDTRVLIQVEPHLAISQVFQPS